MADIKNSSKIFLLTLIFLLLNLTLYPQTQGGKSKIRLLNKYLSEAMQEYSKKDFLKSAELFGKALAIRPDNPPVIYNLSVTRTLSGNKSSALELLNKLASLKLVFHPEKDSDFISIWNDNDFKSIVSKFQDNGKPAGLTGVSFKLQEKNLITEGITYYPKTKTFYVSSIHKRKIVSVDINGKAEDFIKSGQDNIWGLFGMAIDTLKGILWVCTSSVPHIENYDSTDSDMAGIYKYNIAEKKLLKKYILNDGKKHLFGDLTLSAGGKVFISDSRSNTVYIIDPKKDKLEKFLGSDDFISLQGITTSNDRKFLFLADYASGIYKVNISSKQVIKLTIPDSICTVGIDGLYYYNNSLIAVQNGITPNRVIQLFLNNNNKSIVNYKILAANVSPMEDPTLGIINGNRFYFIANSQWNKMNEDGSPLSIDKWEDPTVLKVNLE